jgi:prepilin-type N-terminal cleavage/methylation domain-containing protein
VRRASGGYTLIEVVMVMAVLAVASAVLAPAVGRTVDGVRVRTEVAGIASFLRWAREQAVSRGESHEVALDPQARVLVFRRAGGETAAGVETRRQLSPLLHFATAPGRLRQRITFMPYGGSSGGAGSRRWDRGCTSSPGSDRARDDAAGRLVSRGFTARGSRETTILGLALLLQLSAQGLRLLRLSEATRRPRLADRPRAAPSAGRVETGQQGPLHWERIALVPVPEG